MKKTYLLTAFIGASLFLNSQTLEKAPVQFNKNFDKAIPINNPTPKALGATLWSSDFSNPSEWTFGSSGVQGNWAIGTETDYNTFLFSGTNVTLSDFMNAPGMTSAANGYAFFDAIQYYSNILAQNAWVQMANNIDCTGENEITLKFEQEYRAFNNDKTYVEVSTDGGTTWGQTTDINPTVPGNTNTNETAISRNFTVNGSATVKIRFRWQSTQNPGGGGYGWLVDDVSISGLSDHDISIDNHIYGTTNLGQTLHYHQIPLAQVAPIEGSAVLRNRGSQNQTNVVFTATETVNGVYTSNSTPVGILTTEVDSVVISNNFTPSSIGDYQLDYSISYDNTDDNPLNNTVEPYKFSVGEAIYARDTTTQVSTGLIYEVIAGNMMNPPTQIEVGNTFFIEQAADLTAIDFQFRNVIQPGMMVYGEVYDENLDPIPNTETELYTMVTGDEGEFRTLFFDNPVSLVADQKYILIVKSYSTNFSVAAAGKSAPQTSFIYHAGDNTWYYTSKTPVVRMNFAPAASVSKSAIAGFSHLVGTPSTADSFNVEGYNLGSDITITAPTNFEISTTLTGPYTTSLNLINMGGSIVSTKVYVRLNGPIVNYAQAGNIIISSTGAANRLIALQGETYDYVVASIAAVTNTNMNGEGTSVGDYVILTGVLHCDNFRSIGYDLTLIDNNNDGINLFSDTDINAYVPTEGDEIEVYGRIEQFNGLLQIKPTSITVLSQGATLQTATVVTTLDELTESQFVELVGLNLVNGETLWPSNGSIDVTNGITSYQVRIPAASVFAGTPTPTEAFYLTGIGKQDDNTLPYNSGYQLFPCGVGPSCATIMSVTNNGGILTADVSGLNYQWINCVDSSEIAGETNQTFHTPGGNGLYAVIITDGSCVDTSACIYVIDASINTDDFMGVFVYPNPVNDVLNITNENSLLESVELVTAAGRIVYTSKINSSKHEINVSNLSSGVYFINVKSTNSTKTFKVIK